MTTASDDVVDETSKGGSRNVAELLDPEFKTKLALISRFKFKSNDDIRNRFPFPEELEFDGKEDMYTWSGRILLTQDLVFDILEQEFAELPSSMGMHAFFQFLKNQYIGISFNQVSKYLRTSDDHQQYMQRKRSVKTKVTAPKEPHHTFSIDFGFLQNKGDDNRQWDRSYLFVFQDNFTMMLRATILKTRDASEHIAFLQGEIDKMPKKPRYIKSDNEFKSKEYSAFCKQNGIKPVYSLPSAPTGNARAERAVRTLKTLLFSYWDGDGPARKKQRLLKDVEHVAKIYNSTQNSVTGFRPVDLNDELCPKSVIQSVRKTFLDLASGRNVDKRFNNQLRPGDMVRIDTLALSDRLRALRKGGKFKSSHNASFSSEVYTVVSHSEVDNTVRVKELPSRVFTRGQVLYVPDVSSDDRRAFVTEWQGERGDDGIPTGKPEDPFGYRDRQVAVSDH
jgi:Integrase core domain